MAAPQRSIDIATARMRISEQAPSDIPPSPPTSYVPPPLESIRKELPPLPDSFANATRPFRSSSTRSDASIAALSGNATAFASNEFASRLETARRASSASGIVRLLPARRPTVASGLVAASHDDVPSLPEIPCAKELPAAPTGILSPDATPPRDSQPAADEYNESSSPPPPRRVKTHFSSISSEAQDNARPWSLTEARVRRSNIAKRRFSITALWAMTGEEDFEVDDSLTKGTFYLDSCYFVVQKEWKELKAKISAQSKCNFLLERDVRYLDSRIALLIQNRMALDEVCCYLFTKAQSKGGEPH
jgi:hypothetical protein